MKNQILLACLTPSISLDSINEYMLYQIFNPKLKVKNVRIFSRQKFIRAFVLVQESPDNEAIVEEFHQKQLNVGWLKVYVSHKEYVAFDLTIEEILAMGNCKVKQSMDKTTAFTNTSIQTNQLQSAQNIQKEIKIHKSLDVPDYAKQKAMKEKMPKTAKDITKKANIYFNYNDLGKQKSPLLRFSHDIELKEDESVRVSKESHFKNYKEDTAQLRVDGVNIEKVDCIALINLFGCFGNVQWCLIDKKEKYAIIEMENRNQIDFSIKCTDELVFFDQRIDVSKVPSSQNFKIESKARRKCLFFRENDAKYYRFKSELAIKVNKPSKTLHVTNLSEDVSVADLLEIFNSIHEPDEIFKLNRKGKASSMFLVNFNELWKSVEVLSSLHNKRFAGKLLKISFSHSFKK
jgi:hypothetical protein